MTLDISCVRDSLLTIENLSALNEDLEFVCLDLSDICDAPEMHKYSISTVAYTLNILGEAGFIIYSVGFASDCLSDISVFRLTYQGHEFLDTLRPQAFWDKIHDVCDKTGLKSITAIMEIADILLPDRIKSILRS